MYSTRASIRQLNRLLGKETSYYYTLPPLKPERTPPVRKSGRYKFIVAAIVLCGGATGTIAGMREIARIESAKLSTPSAPPGAVIQAQMPAP